MRCRKRAPEQARPQCGHKFVKGPVPARWPLRVWPLHVWGGDLLDLFELDNGMLVRYCLKGWRPQYHPVHCHGPEPLRGRRELGVHMAE